MTGEAMPSRWVGAALDGTGDAPVRLFCFPHAGGGSALFRPWRAAFGPAVQVRPVVLPGRESRLRERPHRDMAQLIPPLFDALVPYLDRPFALFGHSVGAVIAYEVARRCASAGVPGPLCLFASARRAPHLPPRHRYHELADGAFLAAVSALGGMPDEVLSQPELLDLFLPSLRADFQLNDTYTPAAGPALGCPVAAYAADRDPEASRPEVAAWAYATSGPFRVRTFAGGHFYLSGGPAEVLHAIRLDLETASGLRLPSPSPRKAGTP